MVLISARFPAVNSQPPAEPYTHKIMDFPYTFNCVFTTTRVFEILTTRVCSCAAEMRFAEVRNKFQFHSSDHDHDEFKSCYGGPYNY